MKGTVLYGPRDIRFEERDLPKIINPTFTGAVRVELLFPASKGGK
jgi:hypothetical protein